MKKTLRFLILNCSFFILLTSCGRRSEAPGIAGPPPTPARFVMPNLASEFPGEIKTADHAGQVQLIQFLRTDDPGCRGSISEWNSLQAEFAARGFTCVGAVVDERPVAQLTREAGELAASFPVGLADAPVVGAFGGPAAIRAIPTAFLISREGVILRSYAGYTPLTRFREDIASALDGQPLPDVPPAPGATLPEKSTVKKTAP